MATEENPNAFKHWIGPELLEKLARELERASPGLALSPLRALGPALRTLELKARVRRIEESLFELLPRDYPRALAILLEASRSPSLNGFDLWPVTEFVSRRGLEHFDASLEALHFLTQKFTGEFAVRPFLHRQPPKTFRVLTKWARDPNVHVRRLVSEGTRPRLPWGERVPALIADPGPGLKLLELLRHDPELYVRKSVANHLNDVAKDHPARVLETLERWLSEVGPADARRPSLEWTARRALRTLVKQGDARALKLLGVHGEVKLRVGPLEVKETSLAVNERLEFALELRSTAKSEQKLVVDYVIHHVKANGGRSPKVFKLKTFVLPASASVRLRKRHSLAPITTRTYYPGEHLLEVQVNGKVVRRTAWTLR